MSGIKLPDSLVKQAANKAKELVQQKVGDLSKATGIDPAKFADALDKPLNVSTPQGKALSKKLVSTLFSTGPKDDLTTVDVYGVMSKALIPSINGKLNLQIGQNLMQQLGIPGDPKDSLKQLLGGGGGLGSLVNGLTSSGNPIAEALKKVESGWGIDKEGLTNRVIDALGGKSGLVNGLSDGLKTALTSTVGLNGSLGNQITAVVNNVTQKVNVSSLTDARDLLALVGEVTGSPELSQFFDDGAETTLLSGLFGEAIAQGMPNAVEALITNARDSDIVKKALQQNIGTALVSGNLDTVNLLAGALKAGPILKEVPDAPSVVLSAYKAPKGTTQAAYTQERDKLLTALTGLDPNWGKSDRGGSTTVDLAAFTSLSKDSERALATSSEHAVVLELAKTYRSTSFRSQIKKQYPRAAI